MIRLPRPLTVREKALAVVTALVLLGWPAYQQLIRPSIEQWQSLRDQLYLQQMQHGKLQRNLAVRGEVERQITGLGAPAWQQESDEVTLSSFLSELEVLARRPTLRIVSMNPSAAKDSATHKVYPVRLTVAGRGPEVAMFVAELTNGQTVTGLKSFTIRGLQGGELIECTLNLRMVKLKGAPAAPAQTLGRERSITAVAHGK